MAWSLPWPRRAAPASREPEMPHADAWERHVATLKAHGIPEPGTARDPQRRPATLVDEQAL